MNAITTRWYLLFPLLSYGLTIFAANTNNVDSNWTEEFNIHKNGEWPYTETYIVHEPERVYFYSRDCCDGEARIIDVASGKTGILITYAEQGNYTIPLPMEFKTKTSQQEFLVDVYIARAHTIKSAENLLKRDLLKKKRDSAQNPTREELRQELQRELSLEEDCYQSHPWHLYNGICQVLMEQEKAKSNLELIKHRLKDITLTDTLARISEVYNKKHFTTAGKPFKNFISEDDLQRLDYSYLASLLFEVGQEIKSLLEAPANPEKDNNVAVLENAEILLTTAKQKARRRMVRVH
ncbi:MAG TPA: hypothetical protein VEL47_04495 [Myxococcota bacterium]|nr:hypothetical protein [Myxococcota bacterium]